MHDSGYSINIFLFLQFIMKTTGEKLTLNNIPVPSKEVDVHIAHQPDNVKVILDKIRQTIRMAVPEAEEIFSYGMPAFRFHGMLVWYAAFTNHYSVFIRPDLMKLFFDELKPYKLTKSAIRFPYGTPVQVELISKIVKAGAAINQEKEQLKARARKKGKA
jgi:uncharacterized protein YdhG (YjbR/CyaY superfamily)